MKQIRKIEIRIRQRRLRLTLTSRYNGILPHYAEKTVYIYVRANSLYINSYIYIGLQRLRLTLT